MAVTYNDYNEIPLKGFLRADPHTQLYTVNQHDLVTDDMFWGTQSSDSIYLNYSDIDGRKIKISEGISQDSVVTKEDKECDEWLEKNLFDVNTSKLYVIQGYAGCGKTTLMKRVLKSSNNHNTLYHIDIGQKWSYNNEPKIFFEETLNGFLDYMQDILKRENNIKILDEFMFLARESCVAILDSSIRTVVSSLKDIIKSHRLSDKNSNEQIQDFVSDMGCLLSEKYNTSYKKYQNQGRIENIIYMLMLLVCSENRVNNKESKSYVMVYDNLDVLTNPAVSAEMVLSLWTAISKYNEYVKHIDSLKVKMPQFSVYIAVRKVLFSHITAYLPTLEQKAAHDISCAVVCDVSELYLSKAVLEHRINYWLNNENIEVNIKEKFKKLSKITKIMGTEAETDDEYYLTKSVIDLDGLFNHNFRACANMLSSFIDNPDYSGEIMKIFDDNKTFDWQKTSTIIYTISAIYRSLGIWNKFGFGCKGFDTNVYPTTLFRIILTYLYSEKTGHSLERINVGRDNIPNQEFISLKSIMQLMTKVPFIKIVKKDTDDKIEEKYSKVDSKDINEFSLSLLAEMCSPGGSIINAMYRGYGEDDELWRRPIYFVGGVKMKHTASSFKELKQYFEKAILDDSKSEQILFSLTDEGSVIVNDFIATFEFYSARYNTGKYVKPLHLIKKVTDLNKIVQTVYDAINTCCDRQIIFMNKYMESYDENLSYDEKKDMYLNEHFHPRTNPRINEIDGNKFLQMDSFRPQLHIVRVIYSHIIYFNEVKNFFYEKQETELCDELTCFIGRYLDLYKTKFYDLLKGTIGEYNNFVYNDLSELYRYQMLSKKNVDINRQNKSLLKKLQEDKTASDENNK